MHYSGSSRMVSRLTMLVSTHMHGQQRNYFQEQNFTPRVLQGQFKAARLIETHCIFNLSPFQVNSQNNILSSSRRNTKKWRKYDSCLNLGGMKSFIWLLWVMKSGISILRCCTSSLCGAYFEAVCPLHWNHSSISIFPLPVCAMHKNVTSCSHADVYLDTDSPQHH